MLFRFVWWSPSIVLFRLRDDIDRTGYSVIGTLCIVILKWTNERTRTSWHKHMKPAERVSNTMCDVTRSRFCFARSVSNKQQEEKQTPSVAAYRSRLSNLFKWGLIFECHFWQFVEIDTFDWYLHVVSNLCRKLLTVGWAISYSHKNLLI